MALICKASSRVACATQTAARGLPHSETPTVATSNGAGEQQWRKNGSVSSRDASEGRRVKKRVENVICIHAHLGVTFLELVFKLLTYVFYSLVFRSCRLQCLAGRFGVHPIGCLIGWPIYNCGLASSPSGFRGSPGFDAFVFLSRFLVHALCNLTRAARAGLLPRTAPAR